MFQSVVIVQNVDGVGEIDSSQFPNPDRPVPQKDDDLGFGDAAPNRFGPQFSAEILSGGNVGNVAGGVVIAHGLFLGLRAAMGEQSSDLDFPGAGRAIGLLALASFEFLAAHGSARAIGAN